MNILEQFEVIIQQSETPVVMEFGACDAYHSRIMIETIRKHRQNFVYHLFEPKSDLKGLIDNRLGDYLTQMPDKVRFFQQAIGSEIGHVDFYESGGQKVENGVVTERYFGSSSIRKPKLVTEIWQDMTFNKSRCEVNTFDNHLAQNGLAEAIIDFVWADVQGAEIDLINGGQQAFKRVRYFFTEYANSEYYEGEIGLQEILNLLPDFEVVHDFGDDVLLRNKLF